MTLFSACLLICLSAGLLTGCDDRNTDDPAGRSHSAHRKPPLHRVDVVPVVREPVSIDLTLSGNLEAVQRARIYNEETARITALPFHEGDRVRKGDVLVRLDDSLIRTELEKARAAYRQAEADLKRLQKLLPKNIATEEEVAQAKTQRQLAKADVDYQRTRLDRTVLKSPINGIVTERLYEPGDLPGAQSHLLSVIDPSTLRVRTQLAERYLPLVKPGQPVNLRIDSLGERVFPATIQRIFPTVNSDNHKGTIEIVLDPAPAGAMAGQFVRVNLAITLDDQPVVPTRSIQLEATGAYVYRIIEKDGETSVEKVFFDKGPQYGEKTVVLNKLAVGDRIVNRGFLGLRNGKAVDIATQATQQ